MASEPENHKMDDLLKAYAKQRKGEAGDPFALHPATRKLLQDEVARTYQKESSPSAGWIAHLFGLWPRVGFAATTLLAVAIVIWIVLPNRESANRLAPSQAASVRSQTVADREQLERAASDSTTLALQDESRAYKEEASQDKKARSMRENLQNAPSGPAPDGVTKQARNEGVLQTEAPRVAQSPAPTTTPALTPAEPSEAKRRMDVLAKNIERDKLAETTRESNVALRGVETTVTNALGDRLAVAQKPGEAPLAPAQKIDGAATVSGDASGLYYFQNANILPAARYVQVRQAGGIAGPTNPPQPVLTSFEFEKTGDQVRIVDADGSVYQGRVLSSTDTYLGAKLERAPMKDQAGKTVGELQHAADTPQAQQVLFHASGTNRSLRKLVNIQASFAPPAPAQQPSSAAADTRLPAPSRAQQARVLSQTTELGRQTSQFGVSTQQLMPNIRGRARIGTNQEVPIEAVPAQR